jgi:hypothetical protein
VKGAKGPRRGLVLQGAGSADEAFAREQAVAEEQKAWARAVADRIERGELPEAAGERELIAFILRLWADRVKVTKPPKRGNPRSAAKLHDRDLVALLVGCRIAGGRVRASTGEWRLAEGVDAGEAIILVADEFGVDESTVAKIFRQRRAAVARWFANSNVAHRVGAIRGNSA